MNIVFRLLPDAYEAVEKKFDRVRQRLALSACLGIAWVGGMRASLYNAVTPEAVEALVGFMREPMAHPRLHGLITGIAVGSLFWRNCS